MPGYESWFHQLHKRLEDYFNLTKQMILKTFALPGLIVISQTFHECESANCQVRAISYLKKMPRRRVESQNPHLLNLNWNEVLNGSYRLINDNLMDGVSGRKTYSGFVSPGSDLV